MDPIAKFWDQIIGNYPLVILGAFIAGILSVVLEKIAVKLLGDNPFNGFVVYGIRGVIVLVYFDWAKDLLP